MSTIRLIRRFHHNWFRYKTVQVVYTCLTDWLAGCLSELAPVANVRDSRRLCDRYGVCVCISVYMINVRNKVCAIQTRIKFVRGLSADLFRLMRITWIAITWLNAENNITTKVTATISSSIISDQSLILSFICELWNK